MKNVKFPAAMFIFLSTLTIMSINAKKTEPIKLPRESVRGATETILKLVQGYMPKKPIILECGAFVGLHTAKISHFWPQGFIHSFEPDPKIFNVLKKSCLELSNVYTYQLALGDSSGIMKFHTSRSQHRPDGLWGSGSLLQPTDTYKERIYRNSTVKFDKVINVKVMTLDGWADKFGVDRIDFMWLDMQGSELDMLKASSSILESVSAIYTEVFFREGYEGQYLYEDIKKFLEAAGFTLLGIDFLGFDLTQGAVEGNALFVRK